MVFGQQEAVGVPQGVVLGPIVNAKMHQAGHDERSMIGPVQLAHHVNI
jgi:hypothetical protein